MMDQMPCNQSKGRAKRSDGCQPLRRNGPVGERERRRRGGPGGGPSGRVGRLAAEVGRLGASIRRGAAALRRGAGEEPEAAARGGRAEGGGDDDDDDEEEEEEGRRGRQRRRRQGGGAFRDAFDHAPRQRGVRRQCHRVARRGRLRRKIPPLHPRGRGRRTFEESSGMGSAPFRIQGNPRHCQQRWLRHEGRWCW